MGGAHFLEILFRIVRLEKIKLSRKTFLHGLFSTEEILFWGGERGRGKERLIHLEKKKLMKICLWRLYFCSVFVTVFEETFLL